MTMPTPEQAQATRRAAAFLLHHGQQNLDGVNAVLAELHADGIEKTGENTVRFIMGMASVIESLLPVIYSSSGVWLVQQTIGDLAQIEHGEVA